MQGALISEWKLTIKEWPSVTEAVQGVINHAPTPRLGLRSKDTPGVYRTPLEVFSGLKPVKPLIRALPIERYKTVSTVDEARARTLIGVDELQEALYGMHKEVQGLTTASRKRQVDHHNRRTSVHGTGFAEGDFVLVRRAQKGGHKLHFVWRGPRRICKVRSEWVYEVQNLITDKKEVVHARRLHLYRGDMDGKRVLEDLIRVAEHSELSYQMVECLKDIREVDGQLQIFVEWEGLPDERDWTLEPLTQVAEDVERMLEDFLSTSRSRALKRRALARCGFS